MEKTTAKKWKLLYVASVPAFVISLILAGSWLTSEASQATEFKKALAIGFFVLAGGGFLVAKLGSWFFHK